MIKAKSERSKRPSASICSPSHSRHFDEPPNYPSWSRISGELVVVYPVEALILLYRLVFCGLGQPTSLVTSGTSIQEKGIRAHGSQGRVALTGNKGSTHLLGYNVTQCGHKFGQSAKELHPERRCQDHSTLAPLCSDLFLDTSPTSHFTGRSSKSTIRRVDSLKNECFNQSNNNKLAGYSSSISIE